MLSQPTANRPQGSYHLNDYMVVMTTAKTHMLSFFVRVPKIILHLDDDKSHSKRLISTKRKLLGVIKLFVPGMCANRLL